MHGCNGDLAFSPSHIGFGSKGAGTERFPVSITVSDCDYGLPWEHGRYQPVLILCAFGSGKSTNTKYDRT